jgi:hypothetical protein
MPASTPTNFGFLPVHEEQLVAAIYAFNSHADADICGDRVVSLPRARSSALQEDGESRQ